MVVAVGQGGVARQTGQLIPMSVKVNDKVLLPEFGGQVRSMEEFTVIVHHGNYVTNNACVDLDGRMRRKMCWIRLA